MSQPMNAVVETPLHRAAAVFDEPTEIADVSRSDVRLSLHEDIDSLEAEWRGFEQYADATVFQSFDWLSLWYRHIGMPRGVNAAVVLGRSTNGALLFLLPLAVAPGLVRRLTFLGDGLCDYNAPLMAPGFSSRVPAAEFVALWREIGALLQRRPHLKYDLVELTKMPETVGAQANPFLHLDVGLNPSGAYLTHLTGTWEEFYTAKRSSATRRRDRTKRKRLAEHGEIRFVDPHDADDIARTLETLIEQKSKAFARMGAQNLFARPGYRDFYFDLATNPRTRHLVHVSRLDVGAARAAVNLGLTFRGAYYHVLASYDDGDVSRFGPGAAHLRDLLQRAIEKGFERFDFTIGDERYKLEWSDTTLKLYDHAAAATPRGWPVFILSVAFRRLKRAIKQNPLLWRMFSAVRATVGWLQGRSKRGEDGRTPAGNSPPIAPD
jgi:CelD/BcsL family acetyltransferase involved in cellulose biosynthesis